MLHRIVLLVLAIFSIAAAVDTPYPAHALPGELNIADVEWRLLLNHREIQSADLPFAAEFIIDAYDGSVTGSEELIHALNDIRFILEQPPASGHLTISINLNIQGDRFMPIPRASCCFNATVEAYLDESPVDSGAMQVCMTIPNGNGLDYLLDLCGAARREVVFGTFTGGNVDAESIETDSQVMGLTARFFPDGMIVGGKHTDFGIPASVEFSTWYKVKMLFE